MNQPHDADLETALRGIYREAQDPGSVRCPDSDALAALATGELSPAEREPLADHVISCRRCCEDYQILARTHAQVKRPRRPLVLWAAAAAAALLIAGAGSILVLRSRGADETFRGAGAGQTAMPSTPPDGSTLEAPPKAFRWPAQTEADGYRVKLFGPAGDTIWQSERIKRNEVGLPPLQRSRLSAGRSYFWVVEVEMPLEKTRLGPFRFSLRGLR